MAAGVRAVIVVGWAVTTSLSAESLVIEAKLLQVTPAPTVEQVRPYPRALATYLYEVQKVHEGSYEGETILVVKWAVWERAMVKELPSKIGSMERLKLDRLLDHGAFKRERIVDTIFNRELVLYYDSSSRPAPAVAKLLKEKGRELESGVVKGIAEGWLFLADELQHAETGRFWERDWKKVSRAGMDPLPAMLDFQERLQKVGVQLLVVPVPTKLSIYPERFSAELKGDGVHSEYLHHLQKAGLDVLDLDPLFKEHRKNGENRLLYCAQDSHWSPEACELTARVIYERIEKTKPKVRADLRRAVGRTREIVGDLVRMRSALGFPRERITFDEVVYEKGRGPGHGYDHPKSEVILLGDSHIAVFGDPLPELHGTGGGLPDYLNQYYSSRIEVIAAFGDGVNQARVNLYRQRGGSAKHRDYWVNKRWVVWCFSAREFTRAEKWSTKIPVVKDR
jgi:alginate O-acetyltransferase complex protein AlgJ